MISCVYLVVKVNAYTGLETKVFQEKADAIRQLKAWFTDEILFLHEEYERGIRKAKENEKCDLVDKSLDCVTDIFKELEIEEDEDGIIFITFDGCGIVIQEKEIC